MPAVDKGEAQKRLDDDPAFHIETAIAALYDASMRIVRGIEVLDLELISSAREKLTAADASLLRAVRMRRRVDVTRVSDEPRE